MTTELINALIKAQKEIDHIVQDEQNPFFKSDFASLKAVFDSVKKPLNDNGIYLQQESRDHEGGACVETVFYGHEGKLSTGNVFIPAIKHDPQAFGSALSYAKRYSLLMACGVATTKEDDDAEKAMQRPTKSVKIVNGDKAVATPVRKAIDVKYKLYKTPDNKAALATALNEIGLLNACRRLMPNPKEEEQVIIYNTNKETIKKAKDNSTDQQTQEAFESLIKLYEETPKDKKSDFDSSQRTDRGSNG